LEREKTLNSASWNWNERSAISESEKHEIDSHFSSVTYLFFQASAQMNQPIQLRSDDLSRTVSLVRGIEEGKTLRLSTTPINQHSSMTVSSDTDVIGTQEYDLKLPQNRADAVTKILREYIQHKGEDSFLNLSVWVRQI